MLTTIGLSRRMGAWSVGAQIGAVVGGRLALGGERHELGPGLVFGLEAQWRVLEAPRDAVSLTLGLQLALSHARLTPDDGPVAAWTATDLRASVTASRTLWDVVTPYLAVRAFGGPIFFRHETGGDTTHVQLAAGLGVELGAGLSLHVEGAFLAERGGAGASVFVSDSREPGAGRSLGAAVRAGFTLPMTLRFDPRRDLLPRT